MDPTLPEFKPSWLWRNGDIQSVVASLRVRKPIIQRRARRMTGMTRHETLDCDDGVRLGCLRTPQPDPAAPVAVLIHGWEGSGNSLYMLSAATHLYDAGFEVWRLQLRDHGQTHALNKGIFHSCRIDEVVSAVAVIGQITGGRKLCLGGFSLGGNFALRVAARADVAGLDIAQVVAICPVLHPPSTLVALEQGWWPYNYYFMRKWTRSLRLKHRHWPEIYDIDEIERHKTMRGLTEHLVTHYSDFPDLMTYLNGYSIVGDVLATISSPTLLIAAEDDPIIPVEHLQQLARPPHLTIHTTGYGGHCGFLQTLTGPTWSDNVLVQRFATVAGIAQESPLPARSDAA